MPVEMRIYEGNRRVSARLSTIMRRNEDYRRVWPRVERYIRSTTRRQFTSYGAFLGRPWKPLQPNYRAWKVKHGYSPHILVKTGKMKKGLTSFPMDFRRHYKKSARFGTNSKIAVYHQHGTRRNGKRHLPARPMLKATKRVRIDVKNIVRDYLIDGKR